LLKGAQAHLGKLERDNPAAHHALQRRLEEILGHLGEFPRILTLHQQGLFALGYYHQHAFDRAQARAAAERRRAGQPSMTDDADVVPDPLADLPLNQVGGN
jgi:CRISPR-associated protein Csd1